MVCILLASIQMQAQKNILPGAYQTGEYLPLLKNKKVGLFTNQTAIIGNTHLIDTLISGTRLPRVWRR